MLTKAILAGATALLIGQSALAQAPLSAIDWLSDSLTEPRNPPADNGNSDISENALPENVSVSDIDGPLADGVGLLPVSVTGLPAGLWGQSLSRDLAGRFQLTRTDIYPAMQDLLFTLLLAELDPPTDADGHATLFLARIDTLLAFGALEEADAMLELSGHDQRDVFRRAFDISLLMRTENRPCQTLRNTPELSPTFPARIFCLARGGDWDAAALSLETSRALGYLSDFEDALLARFLDPAIAEGAPRLYVAPQPSPLVFRLLEAVGEPLPTSSLPRAYSQADLHANTGWKAQLEAAERLVRSRALGITRLEGLYFERQAAASGGIWDRVRALQALDRALKAKDELSIATALTVAWDVMAKAELEVAFAQMFSHRLSEFKLPAAGQRLAANVGLLSEQYEDIAREMQPTTERQALLKAIATGQMQGVQSGDQMERAIIDGFGAIGIPVRLQSLTNNDRLGEAMLRAIDLFQNGSHGDWDELSDAIGFFRAIGLENTARRAALQLMLLERRG